MNLGVSNRRFVLLNAANMASYPIYPYAFIQVPAVARAHGCQVTCRDLSFIPQGQWPGEVEALVGEHDPAMILISLRNTDSLSAQNYDPAEQEPGKAYFPIERTRALIAAVRAVTDLKIALGGFGFSLLAEDLMPELRPDLGVFGGPDSFFARFDDLQAGAYADIDNLLYFQDERLVSNRRVFFPPQAGAEYTPQAIEDMLAFYAAHPKPGFPGAPVEIMRGCPHACVFCAEPHVLGRQVRYRDLDDVMADIQVLVDNGITWIYIITSELNPEGNNFILEMADRFTAFNRRQPQERKITWFGANYLLKFSAAEYERLGRSGFFGGWFDISALDDCNARRMRTPYRNETLLADLMTYADFERVRLGPPSAHEKALLGGGEDGPGAEPEPRAVRWTMFLGNPATDLSTVRRTLRNANRAGLPGRFDTCWINSHIRVFDYEDLADEALAVTYSVTPGLERTTYRQILPSFAVPPALLRHFGSEAAVAGMFSHIAETYLSQKYRQTRSWDGFLRQNGTPLSLASWLAALSQDGDDSSPWLAAGKPSERLEGLFSDEETGAEATACDLEAERLVNDLLCMCLQRHADLWARLGFPGAETDLEDLAPYNLAVTLFNRWPSEGALFEGLGALTGDLDDPLRECLVFCVRAALHRYSIVLVPEYRGLFIDE